MATHPVFHTFNRDLEKTLNAETNPLDLDIAYLGSPPDNFELLCRWLRKLECEFTPRRTLDFFFQGSLTSGAPFMVYLGHTCGTVQRCLDWLTFKKKEVQCCRDNLDGYQNVKWDISTPVVTRTARELQTLLQPVRLASVVTTFQRR